MGGTMRLGLYPCKLKEGTLARELYGEELIYERHRHRFEFNNEFKVAMEAAGLIISGASPGLIEAVEVTEHPWFLGVQFHPEFTSRLQNPNPAILSFVEASIKNQ